MTYFIYIQGESGCDYSIGCGNLLQQLNATTLPDAIEEARQIIQGDWNGDEWTGNDYSHDLKSVTLYEADGMPLPIESWYNEAKTKEREAELDAERQEYERLKKKFGDS